MTKRAGAAVVVAVITYRRPEELRALLPELVEQATGLCPAAEVLVVDNDPAASARQLCEGGMAEQVRYVHEPTPGIAAARNRALDEAAASDLLVFIDDDEWPVSSWLQSLVRLQAATGSAGVVGPVVSEYVVEPGEWVEKGRFFDRRRLTTGTAVEVAATNNLLLDLKWVRRQGLRFDERFGLSGGSDTLFTRQLVRGGADLLWCDEAVVVDRVPADRVQRRWVLRRAFRSGNSWSRTSLELSGARRMQARVALTAQGLPRTLGGALQALWGRLSDDLTQEARGVRTCLRGAGMLAGAYGYVYVEYRRPPCSPDASRRRRRVRQPRPRPAP